MNNFTVNKIICKQNWFEKAAIYLARICWPVSDRPMLKEVSKNLKLELEMESAGYFCSCWKYTCQQSEERLHKFDLHVGVPGKRASRSKKEN